MSRSPMARPLKGCLLAVVTAAALSGCGTHPGDAAVVGSETISEQQVDDVALALCSVQSAGQGTPPEDTAARSVRSGALGVLVDSALSQQYGESRGLTADRAQLSQAVNANQETIDALPPSRRAAFREALEGYAAGQLVLVEAGRAELGDSGQQPSDERALAAGTQARNAWVQRNVEVSVDPRFGRFADGAVQPSEGSLSVPASSQAVEGAKQQPGPSWVASLPASQKCS